MDGVQPNIVMAFHVLRLLCGLALACISKIYAEFLLGQTNLKQLEFSQHPNVAIRVDCFVCWHHIHKNHWHKLEPHLSGCDASIFTNSGISTFQHFQTNIWDRVAWMRQWTELCFSCRKLSLFSLSLQGCFCWTQHFYKHWKDVCGCFSLKLGNKEICNGTFWQHTSLADSAVRCCCRDAVRNLYNFVCKCQKLDISFVTAKQDTRLILGFHVILLCFINFVMTVKRH
jgi:hypothetical protein